MRILFSAIVLMALTFSGCLSGVSERDPVTLPTPFSGSLTPEARVVISTGDPVGATLLSSLRLSFTKSSESVSWNCFNSDGTPAGTVTYGAKSPQRLTQEGAQTKYFVPVTIVFEDGSFVASNEVECIDFDYPIGEPDDPSILQTKGVCSGYVTQATGDNISAVGKTMDHRYVYRFKIVNGQRVFNQINLGPWIIQR